MSVDHYAGSAKRWAEGASLVYRPIAEQLIATSPHRLTGRTVLDVGTGTGVATAALTEAGATPLATDLSHEMLSWRAEDRPPATVGDVCALPLRNGCVDDTVAAFVLNHLVEPGAGLGELVRVTRRSGALLACVYSNSSRSAARDLIDRTAQAEGWQIPDWYTEIKQKVTPLLGTAADMQRAAEQAGLGDIIVEERHVDVGVTEPEQLVDYRLGQANYSAWLDDIGPSRADEVRHRLVETVRPVMEPYRPIVVFLSALVP